MKVLAVYIRPEGEQQVEFESVASGPIGVWEEARAAMKTAHGHSNVTAWSCWLKHFLNISIREGEGAEWDKIILPHP